MKIPWIFSVLVDEVPGTTEAPRGGDFTLTSHKGPVSLTGFRGTVVMLFFRSAECPETCSTSLAFMTAVLNQLNKVDLEGSAFGSSSGARKHAPGHKVG